MDPMVLLTFGTGVGGAAVLQGHVYRGVHGEHPELGHLVTALDGPDCYCGTRGCLESIASGTAIALAGAPDGYPTAQAVFAGAAAGQTAASKIVDRAVRAAATAVWTLCHTFLPQRVILGGGMMDHHFELFAQAIRQRLSTATQFSPAAVTVARASLGNDAGIVGGAMLAFTRAQPR